MLLRTLHPSPLLLLFLAALLASLPPMAQAQGVLPESHPKYKTTRQVYKGLERAIGDGRTAPALQMVPVGAQTRMRVAWFLPKQNAIMLDEQAYDLCAGMGADSLNALASLLGHEMAHFYKDHVWVGDFGNGFADLDVGQKLQELKLDTNKMIENETEADYFGGFFGYVAGYNTLGIAPAALQKIYQAYQLGDSIPGYPSLAERQEIARRSADKLRAMVPVFEAGNRLMLLGQYATAARCFDYIARTFPSREILNNAGVARALEAISLFEQGKLRFAYPLELDAETRLGSFTKAVEFGFPGTDEEQIATLLGEAIEWFEKAAAKDKNYATAYVNMACVADLQGEHEDAIGYAEKAIRLAEKSEEPSSLANARIALGIAHANSDEPAHDLAQESFEAAKAGNEGLAQLNLAALKDGALAFVGEHRISGKASPNCEKIDNLDPVDHQQITTAPDAIAKLPQEGKGKPAITIYAKQTEHWYGLVIDTGYRLITLIETSAQYAGESGRGIRRGSGLDQLTEAYGSPSRLVAGRQGAYHVYEGIKIIFELGADGKVRKWMIFGMEEG